MVLPSVSINKLKCKTRRHCGHLQLFIPDVYKYLQSKWPRGAFCVVGITMIDLYPNESWNFVFGQANPGAGVGVFSFARYDPLFYEPHSVANKSPCTSTLVLWRSCKVVHHFRGSCLYFLDLRSRGRSLLQGTTFAVCYRPKKWTFRDPNPLVCSVVKDQR